MDERCTVCGGDSDGKVCPECGRPVCVGCWSVSEGMCVLCVTLDEDDWEDIP